MKNSIFTPYWNGRNTSKFWNDIDRFFEEFNEYRPVNFVYDERGFQPSCDIFETEENYRINVDLPGVKKDDIKVEVTQNMLTISGERHQERKAAESDRVQRSERSYGFFKRSFNLPDSVETDKVEARYEAGVLELSLPKSQLAKPRQIEIQSGKGGVINKLLSSKKHEPDSKESKPS